MKYEKQVTHDGRIGMVTSDESILAKRVQGDQPSQQESLLIDAANLYLCCGIRRVLREDQESLM